MRILFLTQKYLDLYKPIQLELERLGHIVIVEEDKQLKFDYKLKQQIIVRKTINKQLTHIFKPHITYWKKKIKNDSNFSKSFDLLFVINGCSFHPYLLNYLKNKNPQIKSVLYVWDTSKYYDYYTYYKVFNKVVTFDLDDSTQYHIQYLPFYWIALTNPSEAKQYKVSMIGSNHDGRFEIVTKIANQLNNWGYKYFFKIYEPNLTCTLFTKLKYSLCKILNIKPEFIQHIDSLHPLAKSPFLLKEKLTIQETENIILKSECILDTDRASQTGTTPRVIWAIAFKKKIISTNKNLKRLPFYTPNNILIIDRNQPKITKEFLSTPYIESIKTKQYIDKLEIKQWIKNFTEF